MNSLYASLGTTVFETMSRLAAEKGAVNLGQGFPEDDGPRDILEAAARATLEGPNQYPSMRGLPELRQAVAAHYNAHHALDLDWASEVTITSGATEAIAAALLAFIEPGDEVVLFEPLYDAYLPMVKRAGGVPRIVRLEPPHWRFERETVAAAFSDKSRVVIINTPLNPSASVMSRAELELVADLCRKHDAVCVSDEVWEHLLFDDAEHVSMLNILRDRTLKIGSAGKMFSLTGWKVGFACGAPELTELFAKAHQFLTFVTPPNLQRGVTYGLSKPATYFTGMRAAFHLARERLLPEHRSRRLRHRYERRRLRPRRHRPRRRDYSVLSLLRKPRRTGARPPLLRQARRDSRSRRRSAHSRQARTHIARVIASQRNM